MEHKGIQFSVLQTANPTGWRWSFQIEGRQPKIGAADSRQLAIRLAEIAIDKAIRMKPMQSG
jgi:hypothetical protein